mmetsp:Transcript_77941/g.216132  ORF Transcript_77941/g.216132 Transcript_77941/m.216132 type:complete len:228 (+) Transcript_77941:271-954(+)
MGSNRRAHFRRACARAQAPRRHVRPTRSLDDAPDGVVHDDAVHRVLLGADLGQALGQLLPRRIVGGEPLVAVLLVPHPEADVVERRVLPIQRLVRLRPLVAGLPLRQARGVAPCGLERLLLALVQDGVGGGDQVVRLREVVLVPPHVGAVGGAGVHADGHRKQTLLAHVQVPVPRAGVVDHSQEARHPGGAASARSRGIEGRGSPPADRAGGELHLPLCARLGQMGG